MSLDRESSFKYEKFRQNGKKVGVNLHWSGIEFHNAIGQGERLHYPIHLTFNITSEDHSRLPDLQLLRLAVKAINDANGPDGLVPSLLLFDVLLFFSCPTS